MTQILEGYTRISTILSMLPSIIGTSEEGYDTWGYPLQTINRDILKTKCEIGTNVHAAIHSWTCHDFSPLASIEKGYFESFIKWQEIVNLTVQASELRLYDESYKITGAIDLLGKIQGSDSLILIDFKTSSSPDLKKWTLQAAFYHHLLLSNKFLVSSNAMFVQLNKSGQLPKCHTITIDNSAKNLMICAFNLYKYLKEK